METPVKQILADNYQPKAQLGAQGTRELVVLLASSRPCAVPDDSAYVPVQAGAGEPPLEGFARPEALDEPPHNDAYGPFEALRWGWRNVDADALGLVTSDAAFSGDRGAGGCPATGDRLLAELGRAPVVLAKPTRFVRADSGRAYAKRYGERYLGAARALVADYNPRFIWKYDEVMARSRAHAGNVFLMRRDLADEYCDFPFGVLDRFADLVAIEIGSPDACVRALGVLLLDYWVESHGLPYVELPATSL